MASDTPGESDTYIQENQEDYRYCPLSLLESCKAVVNALAEGRIAPFYKVEDGTLPPEGDPERYRGTVKRGDEWTAQLSVNGKTEYLGAFETKEDAALAYRKATKGRPRFTGLLGSLRYAPSFVPKKGAEANLAGVPYTIVDIARYLGRTHTRTSGDTDSDPKVTAALDALYLLEVRAIKTFDIKSMNWAQLGRYVADIKARRESASECSLYFEASHPSRVGVRY